MADGGDDGDAAPPPGEAEIGAAVDDAMADEVRRQKARFVQRILGVDRREGTGRADEQWDSEIDRRLGTDGPDRPDEDT